MKRKEGKDGLRNRNGERDNKKDQVALSRNGIEATTIKDDDKTIKDEGGGEEIFSSKQ